MISKITDEQLRSIILTIIEELQFKNILDDDKVQHCKTLMGINYCKNCNEKLMFPLILDMSKFRF